MFRIRDGVSALVGNLAAPCGPAGLAFGPDGRLYVTNTDHVQHPYLEGADGIVLDGDDDVYAAANERNAVTVVTRRGEVRELFRNGLAARACATRVRSSSRPARCWSAASCA